MRGFIVLSKKNDQSSSLIQKLPQNTPKVRFMSDLTMTQTREMIRILNSEAVKIYIFKFLHDLHSVFGSKQKVSSFDLGNGYLSAEFFEQIDILRNSCNDFEGL